MLRFTAISSCVVLSTLVAAPLVVSSAGAAQDQRLRDHERQVQPKEQEIEEFEGLLVDLHHFMAQEDLELDEAPDRLLAGENNGGPIALVVKDEGMIRTRTNVYVVLFESEMPDNATPRPAQDHDLHGQRSRYQDDSERHPHTRAKNDQLREKLENAIGQRVTLKCYKLERHGLTTIVVREMQHGEHPDQDRDQRDLEEGDRDLRDRY